MENTKSVSKIFLGAGLILAFVFLLCSFNIYAYDTYEIYPQVVWANEGGTGWEYANNPEVPDSAFYFPATYETKEIGFLTGFPVPYYSDGDHVSLFVDFTIGMEDVASSQWLGLFVRPIGSTSYLSTATNTGNGEWLRVNIQNQANLGEVFTGSFHWEDLSQSCSYKILITKCGDGSSIGSSRLTFYHVTGVFDLNLVSSKEMKPFLLTAKLYMGYPNISEGYGPFLSKDYHFRITDTSMYGAIEDLASILEDMDFSGLSGLADLSTTIENWYTSYTSVSSTIVDRLDEIIDDGETDEDVTRWNEEASLVASQASDLHDLEESLVGTLSDFEFPTVANQTAVNNVLLPFWQNELVISLTLAFMALMIVFLIL